MVSAIFLLLGDSNRSDMGKWRVQSCPNSDGRQSFPKNLQEGVKAPLLAADAWSQGDSTSHPKPLQHLQLGSRMQQPGYPG